MSLAANSFYAVPLLSTVPLFMLFPHQLRLTPGNTKAKKITTADTSTPESTAAGKMYLYLTQHCGLRPLMFYWFGRQQNGTMLFPMGKPTLLNTKLTAKGCGIVDSSLFFTLVVTFCSSRLTEYAPPVADSLSQQRK